MRVLATGDTHLGFRQYGFDERLKDFEMAATYVFEQAIALNAGIVVLGGDQFNSPLPASHAVYHLQQCVSRAPPSVHARTTPTSRGRTPGPSRTGTRGSVKSRNSVSSAAPISALSARRARA